MHPITTYDAAVREHERAVVEQARRHEVAIRRRERATSRTRALRTADPRPAAGPVLAG